MNYTMKTTHQLCKGDRVTLHGGVFLITSDARLSRGHLPEDGVGPTACLVFDSVCESGNIPGYFQPGSSWTVQGNHHAGHGVVHQTTGGAL